MLVWYEIDCSPVRRNALNANREQSPGGVMCPFLFPKPKFMEKTRFQEHGEFSKRENGLITRLVLRTK